MINYTAVYVLWLREMKRYFRARSRVAGTLAMPLFLLAFFGMGFRGMQIPNIPDGVDYINYLVPGIVGMSMLFTSVFAGLSVLWDREFGFLKEIMVAPVNRVSIVLGRIAGGSTTALVQGCMILLITMLFGFRPHGVTGFFFGLVFMACITTTFIGMGLVLASRMKDMQGFSLIMNFVIFPMLFLSGAFYPVENLPQWVAVLSFIDPLTYGIDGLRGALIGVASRPLFVDFAASIAFAAAMVFLGAYFFENSEAV